MPSIVFISALSLVAFGAVSQKWKSRKSAALRFKPDRSSFWSASTGLVATASVVLSTKLFPQSGWAVQVAQFSLFSFFGVFVPLFFALVVEESSLESLGITRRKARRALPISVSVTIVILVLAVLKWPSGASAISAIKVIGTLLSQTLAESVLFCGFIHRRLDRSFGFVTAIVATAVISTAWQVGIGLALVEPSPPMLQAMIDHLVSGLALQCIFSASEMLLLSVWPFASLSCALLDICINFPIVLSTVSHQRFISSLFSLLLMVILGSVPILRVGLSSALHSN